MKETRFCRDKIKLLTPRSTANKFILVAGILTLLFHIATRRNTQVDAFYTTFDQTLDSPEESGELYNHGDGNYNKTNVEDGEPSKFRSDGQSRNLNTEPRNQSIEKGTKYCSSLPDIYYVKIHKTGSSTFQNIMYRLGLTRNLYFALFACPYGMTYPHPPHQKYLFANPTKQDFKGYNLITDHTMFDPEAFKPYMSTRPEIITLLRHPLQQLKSSFGFWGLPLKFKIPGSLNNGDAVMTYLQDPMKYEQTRDSFSCGPKIQISQTRNPQSHHLGLTNYSATDSEAAAKFIRELDSKLDLVLILERFEESLVLFKRKYCLTFKDILHLNLFSTKFFGRKTYDPQSNEEALILHRNWSKADYMLYDHFRAKLDAKVLEEGENFQDELQTFRNIKDTVKNFCKLSCSVFDTLRDKTNIEQVRNIMSESLTFPVTPYSSLFNITRGDCALMMFETLLYDDTIKQRQWPNVCERVDKTVPGIPKVPKSYCNKNDYFVLNFPWTVLKNTAYFRKEKCLENF